MKKAALATLLTLTSTAHAADIGNINLSGYGSVRAGITLGDEVSNNMPYDDNFDAKSESRFAIQAQSQLSDKWSATIMMRAAGDQDFDLEARWAYLNYELSPQTILTFGRFALPYFRHSDTQDVGYSHNYARMPESIYAGQEFDIIEGVRAVHTMFIDDGELVLKGSFGSFDGSAETGQGTFDTEINNIIQFSAEYTYDWFSIYAGVVQSEITLDINDLLDMQLMGALPGYTVNNGSVIAPNDAVVYDMNELYVNEDKGGYWSVGTTLDFDQWQFNVEYASYGIDDSFFVDNSLLYVAASYSFGKSVISLVHESVDHDYEYKHANASDPFVNAYASGVTDAFFMPTDYDAQGIHYRYDIKPGIAYKAEFTYAKDDLSGDGSNMVSMGIDFVF